MKESGNFFIFTVSIYIYTIKPVYKDRSREKAKMVIIDRWER